MLGVLLFAYPGAGLASAAGEETDTYLVGFQNYINEALIEGCGGETGETWERIAAAEVELTQEEAACLSSQDAVSYIEQNNTVAVDETATATASPALKNWGIERVQAEDAWDNGVTGAGVDVAVIDTGISTSHPSLTVTGGFSAVSYTDSYDDDNGHGSHTAGIIAANQPSVGLVGVAPDVNLYAVKVLDQDGQGPLAQVLTGIDWAIANDIDVISMSFGTLTNSNTMRSMLDEAYEEGIIVAAAAGNRGEGTLPEGRVEFPARFDSTVAVGAVDEHNERAYFSATGEAVEIAAPGVDIVSSYKDATYGPLSGTSMATPFVAGAFALLKEAYPEKSAPELRAMLQDEAIDLGESGRDPNYGYGLLQIPDLSESALDQDKENPLESDDKTDEKPVEEDIEENPLKDDPIQTPEEEGFTPADVQSRVVYNEDGSADVHVFWDKPENETIVSHRIYRDDEFVESVENGNLFKDESVEPGTYVYEVSAVDVDGNESPKSEPVEVDVKEKSAQDGGDDTEAPADGDDDSDQPTDEEEAFTWPAKLENPPEFTDINEGYWASEPIQELSDRGIIQGNDGYFYPGDAIRRGQAVAMIGRMLDWENDPAKTRFPDVTKNYFASGFIAHAVKTGYIGGFADGSFRPNRDITRGQMAAILGNVFDLEMDSGAGGDGEVLFRDVNAKTTGADAIVYLAENDIISGYDDGTFRPGEKLTRAQFASIFYKLGEHLIEESS